MIFLARSTRVSAATTVGFAIWFAVVGLLAALSIKTTDAFSSCTRGSSTSTRRRRRATASAHKTPLWLKPSDTDEPSDDSENDNLPKNSTPVSNNIQQQQQIQEEDAMSSMSFDELLDQPFFVPENVPDSSPLKWFANLVEQDYVTAEALFASFFITCLVVLTQEILRVQLYGDQYVPFVKGTAF